MANYKETIVNGNTWTRSNRVNIENPYAGTPLVTFSQEEVTVLANGKVLKDVLPSVSAVFNPADEIQLLDPQSLQPTGQTMSKALIYQALFSEYLATAAKAEADAAAAEAARAALAAVTPPPADPAPAP
jgi:hypothetical protein